MGVPGVFVERYSHDVYKEMGGRGRERHTHKEKERERERGREFLKKLMLSAIQASLF